MKHLLTVLSFLVLSELSWGQYKLDPIFQNDSVLSLPLAMVSPDDGSGRIFIAQLHGKIVIFHDNKGFASSKIFLDISDRVFPNASELGLLGFTFHPHFKENGYIYVNYIAIVNNYVSTVISRFTISPTNPDSAISGSEKIIMTVTQPGWAHKGGSIEFGHDGFLYIPLGDGSDGGDPPNNAQNLSSLLGKILRIDVDREDTLLQYAIPKDNPFVHDTGKVRKEIYAYGFRNPWQSSFDTYSGTLWVGDVGQDRYEEIDTIVRGGNYGWRMMEGSHQFIDSIADTGDLILPIWDYDHYDPTTGVCIVGGFVYHGLLFPELRDKYIYGDFASARIWALTYDNGSISNQLLVDHGTSGIAISSLYEDQVGNIYVVSISDGKIYKLVSTAGVTDIIAKSKYDMRIDRNILDGSHPFSTVYFDLPATGRASLSLFDAQGRQVQRYCNRDFDAGNNSYHFDTRSLISGIYFLRLITEFGMIMQKFIVLS